MSYFSGAFCEDVLTVTVQKAARSNYKANLSAAATEIRSNEGTLMFYMRACELGRLTFAYFSIAVDRKVSRHQGETECKKTFKGNDEEAVDITSHAIGLSFKHYINKAFINKVPVINARN